MVSRLWVKENLPNMIDFPILNFSTILGDFLKVMGIGEKFGFELLFTAHILSYFDGD